MNHLPAPDIPPDLRWLKPHRSGARNLQAWRGRAIVMHFWTRSCVDCRQVADELHRIVAPYGSRVQVIGVHAPRFPAERDDAVVEAGMEQLGFGDPVVNDADYRLCRLYGLQKWPTIVVIDTMGRLVGEAVGTTGVAKLATLLAAAGADEPVQASGRLPATGGVTRSGSAARRRVSHPCRLLPVPDGWIVSEQGGDLVVNDHRLQFVRRIEGFGDPAGMCQLPDGRIAVADASRHQVIAVDPGSGERQVIAGTGTRAHRRARNGTRAADLELATPLDVAWWRDQLVIATTGLHQLIAVPEADPRAPSVVIAGSSAEGLKDGSARRARLAMPSALAPDEDRLWFTDADSSALRWVEDGEVGTAIGSTSTSSGHRDGDAADALLQHPCGVAIDGRGRLLVADTFNGALRQFDPATNQVVTLATGLHEPTDVAATVDGAMVVEQAGHAVSPVVLRAEHVAKPRSSFSYPPTIVAEMLHLGYAGEGAVELDVTTDPPELLVESTTKGQGMTLRLSPSVGGGRLAITAVRGACEGWCSLDRLSWSIPLRVDSETGLSSIPLLPR